jgi:BirA family biotin operon repressor/biotin-[acetyl-CoA-carboxylase] ligase
MRIFWSTPYVLRVPGDRARTQLAATRFADVRWVATTGSTNADALELARGGAAEGVVVVADHQTAGRGRAGRTWTAPSGASLLMTVLLRPPSALAPMSIVAMGLAASDAVADTAGFTPRLKWPNDLVWPGDGSAPDRKLAGILAEAEWSSGAAAVVIGMGLNVTWPRELPDELAEIATAVNHVVAAEVDREDLLIAILRRLDERYSQLLSGGEDDVRAAWKQRSATLGRRVRVEVPGRDREGTAVEGMAVDVTGEGHLVVETDAGPRRTFAVADVVHLRTA